MTTTYQTYPEQIESEGKGIPSPVFLKAIGFSFQARFTSTKTKVYLRIG